MAVADPVRVPVRIGAGTLQDHAERSHEEQEEALYHSYQKGCPEMGGHTDWMADEGGELNE